MRISLTVTEGPHAGQIYSFEEHDNFIVGRSKRAHFQLPLKDKYFSRIHFMVEVNPPYCRLMDMGSTNGTYVNGQKVDLADLRDGDVIKAGQTVLRVSVLDTEVPRAPSTSRPVAIPEPLRTPGRTTRPEPQPVPHSLPPPTPPRPPQEESIADVIPVTPEPADPFATPSPEIIPEYGSIPPAGVRPPAAPRNVCRVCLAPLPPGTAPPEPNLPPLCAACWEQIRRNPQPLEGYYIARQLGHGAMGVVSLALRRSDGLLVALKTIIPAVAGSKSNVERFFREAAILKELDHPNIVAFRDMGETEGQLYFAMDYVRGRDASKLLKESGPMAIPRAVGLVCHLLEALEYAHAKGFVHRDIKPANILVEEMDGRETAKLADFGLARVYQTSQLSGLTLAGDLGGTIAFMAPEQITHYREAKPPVDQYAAGATLYNLLTDKFTYDLVRQVQQQILMVLQNDPVPIQARRKDIPKGLADVVHRAMAREPADRFADVRAMRKALVKFT